MSTTTIPLNKAILYIGAWAGRYIASNKLPYENPARAHLIPVDDLLSSMLEMGIAKINEDGTYTVTPSEGRDIRAYMALDIDKTDPYKQQKLLIVGTQKDANGIYRDIVQDENNPSSSTELIVGSGVFDFTTPCPSECDPDSPLNS